MGSDRDMWRAAMKNGEAEFERVLLTKMENKRQKLQLSVSRRPDLPCSYCDRVWHLLYRLTSHIVSIGKLSHQRIWL
jgi:hypothetical protein